MRFRTKKTIEAIQWPGFLTPQIEQLFPKVVSEDNGYYFIMWEGQFWDLREGDWIAMIDDGIKCLSNERFLNNFEQI